MQIKLSFKVYSAILGVLAVLALLVVPGQVWAQTAQNNATTSISADIYLTGGMLQPLFQSNINQQVPKALSAAISSMVSQLPKQDQAWASEMANALLQPSATLVSVTPQDKGLLITLRIDLYQGDPKPTTTDVLIGFSVSNSSTVQVTALPINGKPGLVNGPLLTFHVPIGTLNAISAAVNCGDADLKVNLNFPISLSSQKQTKAETGFSTSTHETVPLSQTLPASTAVSTENPNSYVELPASSLAQLDGTFGTITVSSSLTAKNIRIGVDGKNLTLTDDIYWYGIPIGTAVSTMVPGASNGNLVMHVTNTDLHIGFVSFPTPSYNQQIEQMVNSRLNGALKGVFTVLQAAVGGNAQLPCAASNSLVMGGIISLG
jgi:hypothetical protein